ncbi:MAG: phosphoglycerate kinase [Clostridiales Family XIII bacterium]|nr:phosphoglycerate kinase [Clostridiales Family XIII bacterium]
MMKKTLKDIDVRNKKVIVRCDFNVPLDDDGNITDDTRIVGALPTIEYLLAENASIILMSHLGRPKGEANPKYSLAPVAADISKKIGREVIFKSVPEVVNAEVKEIAAGLKSGEVLLLENTRFRKEEEKNGEDFAKELSDLAEVFVNDAFGAAHRAHSSTAGISAYLPTVSGFLIEKELNFLGHALENPARPFVAIMGGSKVSDKIKVIESLLSKADTLLIGGGMMFTFLKAEGLEVGKSILDEEGLELAGQLIKLAREKGVTLLLPVDVKAADAFDNDSPADIYSIDEIPADRMGLDIGPKTAELFASEIASSGTVLWNGPMGVFELPNFAAGTKAVAEAMAANEKAVTIIGGGDSAAAVSQFGLADRMSHVSTGGGASLEFIENGTLPCIEVIADK